MEYWRILREALGSRQLILTGAAGAILKNEKILLVRRDACSEWHIPGGLQELDESVSETAEREIREELGLKLRAEKLVSVYSSPKWLSRLDNGDKIQQVTFFFLMSGSFSPDQIILQADEISEYGFFALDQIPEETRVCCREKVRDLLAFTGETILK